MKKTAVSAVVAALLLFSAGRLVSQSPQPAVDPRLAQTAAALDLANQQLKQAIQALQAMKSANQQLIEKQQKALEQLDAMQKESDQIRILGRRI